MFLMIPAESTLVCRKASKRKFPSFLTTTFGTLSLLLVCLFTLSCRKREAVNTEAVGALKLQPIKFADAIPEDYGPLIGVTQNPTDPAWVGLWFQRADKSINAVFVNVNEGRIYQNTLTIPR